MLIALLMTLIMMFLAVVIIMSSIKLAEYLADVGYGTFIQLVAYLTSVGLQSTGVVLIFLSMLGQ